MSGAVFLSYASQDQEAARRICAALREAGVEVWFDESELRGGDAWDAKIRKQIRECALFVPVISAHTQARPEGYFRLEWKLAVDRSHLLAEDHPFLFPVVLGEVTDATGRVPEKFKEVQWTRLRLDETPRKLAARVARLLSGDPAAADRPHPAPPTGEARHRGGARRAPAWLWVAGAVVAGLAAYGGLKPRHAPGGIAPSVAAPAGPALSVPRQLAANARELFERLDSTRDDYALAADLLKQAMAADGVDAEVWAAYAQLNERYLIRGFDVSAERQELARTSVQRALRLDPQSFEGRLAQARLLIVVGGDPRDLHEGEQILRVLHQERPDDQRVLRGLATAVDQLGNVNEASALNDESARLPGGDPLALYDKSLDLLFVGRAAEAEAALRASLAQKPFSSALLIGMWYAMMLHGDLDRAKSMLDEISSEQLTEDRGCYFSFLLYVYRHEPDAALARLRAVPRDWLYDNWYRGPKSLLIGVALHTAGRPEAAAVEWQTALKLLEARLADNPSSLNLRSKRVLLLAYLGEHDQATHEFSTLLQLSGIDLTRDEAVPLWVTEDCAALGRRAEAIRQIARAQASRISVLNFSAIQLRLDPLWESLRRDPEFAKVIAKAEAVEKADGSPAASR